MPSQLPIPNGNGPAWALFLDVDGTLLNLAEHPDAVTVPEGLASLLNRLKTSLHGALALISGRSLASLDTLLGDAGLDGAGCHGAELRISGKKHVAAVSDDILPFVANRLTAMADAIPLTMVELKPHTIAFHYRPPILDSVAARRVALEAIGGEEKRLRLLDGKQVVEILPCDVGKGVAIATFLRNAPYHGRLPVFVGDDVTDEEGFDEVNNRGGISIRVGKTGPSKAVYHAASVAVVLSWLAGPVCNSLGCNSARGAP
ncbi:MAG: trehalose-phosphatase [Rhodospirillales bacterium]|nr:trehalose-phosphatase [Rhodospirillales bacterium]